MRAYINVSNIRRSGPTPAYYLISALAVLHSALLLVRATVTLPAGLPTWSIDDRLWITLVTLWFVWPIVLVLPSGRSWLRLAAPLIISLMFLAPCARYYYWLIEEELNGHPRPTPDNPIVLKEEELGSGFRRVALEEWMRSGFESIYHGEYLFYRDRKLASFSAASVSPSRRFAIYRELDSERLLLFRVADQSTIVLSPAESGRGLEEFEWNEAAGYVAQRSATGLKTFPLK